MPLVICVRHVSPFQMINSCPQSQSCISLVCFSGLNVWNMFCMTHIWKVCFLRLSAWNMFCLSQYVSSISMTTFLKTDETQIIHSREISPTLSKKVPRLWGSVFYVLMPEIYFARLNDYFSQKRWDTKNSFNGDPSSALQKSISYQRVYSVSFVSIIVSLSHVLSHWLKFLH